MVHWAWTILVFLVSQKHTGLLSMDGAAAPLLPLTPTDTEQRWPEEHYLFHLLTHLLPLRGEHSHQWLPACPTSSKRKKETQFQSHWQSRMCSPSLASPCCPGTTILNYFTAPVEVAFKSCLQLLHFFSPSLEEIKHWWHRSWNCSPSYWNPVYYKYTHMWGSALFGGFAFPARLYIPHRYICLQRFYVSFLIATDLIGQIPITGDITPFTERHFCLL